MGTAVAKNSESSHACKPTGEIQGNLCGGGDHPKIANQNA